MEIGWSDERDVTGLYLSMRWRGVTGCALELAFHRDCSWSVRLTMLFRGESVAGS
jgi:hypothetical protein